MNAPVQWLAHAFASVHAWVFEALVQPLLFAAGGMHLVEEAFLGTELALAGALQIGALLLLLRPLEALLPLEARTDRAAIRTDIIYTLLTRLGLLPLLFFFILLPLEGTLDSLLHGAGLLRPNLETLIPPLARNPVAAFFCYLVVLDCAGYWIHRAQHRFAWWWALHAVHHSQRQLTFWSDNRNHVLDDLIVAILIALVVRLIGVPPGQFIVLVAAVAMIENLSHANTRLRFGRLGERLLVSPRFHRWHHAAGDGHEGTRRGINFAALLPLWDILFRTAAFRNGVPVTGIRGQRGSAGVAAGGGEGRAGVAGGAGAPGAADAAGGSRTAGGSGGTADHGSDAGVDYGAGWWSQQRLGCVRLWRALAPPAPQPGQ